MNFKKKRNKVLTYGAIFCLFTSLLHGMDKHEDVSEADCSVEDSLWQGYLNQKEAFQEEGFYPEIKRANIQESEATSNLDEKNRSQSIFNLGNTLKEGSEKAQNDALKGYFSEEDQRYGVQDPDYTSNYDVKVYKNSRDDNKKIPKWNCISNDKFTAAILLCKKINTILEHIDEIQEKKTGEHTKLVTRETFLQLFGYCFLKEGIFDTPERKKKEKKKLPIY